MRAIVIFNSPPAWNDLHVCIAVLVYRLYNIFDATQIGYADRNTPRVPQAYAVLLILLLLARLNLALLITSVALRFMLDIKPNEY